MPLPGLYVALTSHHPGAPGKGGALRESPGSSSCCHLLGRRETHVQSCGWGGGGHKAGAPGSLPLILPSTLWGLCLSISEVRSLRLGVGAKTCLQILLPHGFSGKAKAHARWGIRGSSEAHEPPSLPPKLSPSTEPRNPAEEESRAPVAHTTSPLARVQPEGPDSPDDLACPSGAPLLCAPKAETQLSVSAALHVPHIFWHWCSLGRRRAESWQSPWASFPSLGPQPPWHALCPAWLSLY